jgi:uncharacterized membrane protein
LGTYWNEVICFANERKLIVLKPVSTAKKIYCKTRQKHSDSRLLSFILKRRIMFLISSSLRATVVGGATDAIALLFAFGYSHSTQFVVIH